MDASRSNRRGPGDRDLHNEGSHNEESHDVQEAASDTMHKADAHNGSRGNISEYTLGEEIANATTHGLGFLGAVVGTVILLVSAGRQADPWKIVSFAIYGTTLMFLYISSTLYHAFPSGRAKNVFRRLDYAAIYALIAGTYTPYTLIPLRGAWGWVMFGLIWGTAIAGISLKMVFFHKHKALAVAMYVVMGWLVVIAVKPIVSAVPFRGLCWLTAGGLFYTTGVAIFARDDISYNHAIWHLFVLAGSLTHFFGIYFYLA